MTHRHPFDYQLADESTALLRLARSLTRNEHRAQDLTQETLRKAWSGRASYKAGTRLRAWLFTILRNTHFSNLRKHSREVEDADGALAARLSHQPSQEHVSALRELESALAALPTEQRDALLLVGGEGYSQEEAARASGCAVGTIKSRVCRARVRLREVLDVSAH